MTIITESVDRLVFYDINERELKSPILWCREGEFRIIPKEVILNLIAGAIHAKLSSDKTTNPQLQIMWSQGISINNLAGRALIGE